MANIRIILIVDTDNISKSHVDGNCQLIDTTGLMSSPDPRKFETTADAGTMIEWSGLAKNHVDCVSIDSIVLEKKPSSVALFGVPILIGSGGFIRANLMAHILEARPNNAKAEPREETYKINFTVIKNKTGAVSTYDIDPKIKGNP